MDRNREDGAEHLDSIADEILAGEAIIEGKKKYDDVQHCLTLPSGKFSTQGEMFQGPGIVLVKGGEVVGGTATKIKT